MFPCPVCRVQLRRTPTEKGIIWTCPRCAGHAATLSIVRKNVEGTFVDSLWRHIRDRRGTQIRRGRRCPSCRKSMVEVTKEVISGPVELDVCRKCQFMWFDPGESEAMPALPPNAEPEMHPKAREALALAEIEGFRSRHEPGILDPPDEWWKWLVTMAGYPAEDDPGLLSRKPILTWVFSILIVLFSVLAFGDLDSAVGAFGLIPAEFSRWGGATFLTSFFVHAGLLHLIGNVYFLMIFGDNVEDAVGHVRFAILLIGSILLGDAFHIMSDPDSTVPCIGASGGIAGLLAFYGLAFPHVRIQFVFFVTFLRIPALVLLVIWVGVQVFGVSLQTNGIGHVSYASHLGGATVGIIAWSLWRKDL
ncbi:MAG: hypothetical protein CMO55_09385 [Verrucomicrobiales bacterium]|nr:hypothetical protein [Verrucomicrobiales bacterium]